VLNRPENANMIIKLTNIALAVMRKVDSEIIDKTYAMQRLEPLSKAILLDSYKEMYKDAYKRNPNLRGVIKPKVNSWISLINNTQNESLDKFGLTPYDNTVLENIAKRVALEIDTYKNKYMFMVRNLINYVKDMIKTLNNDPVLENSFKVQLIKEAPIVTLLQEKGWVNEILGRPSIDEISSLPSNMSNTILDVQNDLEVKVLAEESFKNISDGTIATMNNILASKNPQEFKYLVNNLRLKDINALLGLIIVFRDRLKGTDTSNTEYDKIVSVLNTVIKKYKQIKTQYDLYINNKTIVIAVENIENNYIIYALEDTFNNYINDKSGSLKTIIGAIFSEVNLYKDVVDGVYRPLYIRYNDLVINKAKYDSIRDTIQNSLILKNKNETASSLRAYYLIAFDKVTANEENKDRQGAETYINSRNIGELYEVDVNALELIEKYGSLGTNFHPFSEAMEEAQELLRTDDMKYAAGYAALKLILLYLVSQTEIV